MRMRSVEDQNKYHDQFDIVPSCLVFLRFAFTEHPFSLAKKQAVLLRFVQDRNIFL